MILLIEDDVISRHILTALLRRMRLAHQIVQSVEEAAEVMALHAVDLLLVDMRLPDAEGLAMVDALVTAPFASRVPVLYCTSFADAAAVERALATGTLELVRKPIDVTVLADDIARALRRSPARL